MKGLGFTKEMLEATIAGRKDVTRRLGGLKEINQDKRWQFVSGDSIADFTFAYHYERGDGNTIFVSKVVKPRYQVGEIVFVQEAWMAGISLDALKPSEIPEAGRVVKIWYWKGDEFYADQVVAGAGRIRSPRFMPAWAARYFRQITDVSVVRVKDITEEDAIREGLSHEGTLNPDGYSYSDNPIEEYAQLWDSINGKKHPWSSNPWCFRYQSINVERPKES